MRKRLMDLWDFLRFVLQRFQTDRGIHSAAALTYTTLFAVVPMMTVTFAMLSAIPAFQGVGEQIQHFVFRNFVPSTGETVQLYLQGFILQARQLTWVGVIVLAFTAYLMLLTIERSFNAIWRLKQPRRGVSSFLLYWAILSLGPLLLGSGFLLSSYIASLALLQDVQLRPAIGLLLALAPLLFSVAAFTLLYAAVPNTRVPLRHALVGGLFAALLFEVAKALFGLFVSLFPGYQLIYGAFATVPLFLLWIYLSWVILLFGAELVCNLSSSRRWRQQALPKVLVLLGLLRLFLERQQRGRPLWQADLARLGWPLPEDEWDELVGFLERESLVCRVSGGGWVLCRDLSHYSLNQLLLRSPWPMPRAEQLPAQLEETWYGAFRQALEMLQGEQAALFDGSLQQWLQPERH